MHLRRVAPLALAALVAGGCAGESAEGRPWVHKLAFHGVKQVPESELRGKIALQETSPLWWLGFPRHYLDPFALETDGDRIEAWYHAHGLFGARVTAADAHRRDAASVDVDITVDEGAPTNVSSVTVDTVGRIDAETNKLLLRGQVKPGERFDHARYLADRDARLARLRDRGYAWGAVRGEITVDRARRTAAIRFIVEPGPRVTFGATTIAGARAVEARLIARRAHVVAGRRYDPQALENARARVEALRLFSSVTAEIAPAPGHPEVADVTITVREAPLRELRLGVGAGVEPQRTDVHGEATHTWRNWLGDLRTLKVRAEAGWVALPAFWDLQAQGPIGTVEATVSQADFPWRTSSVSWTVGFDLGIEYGYQFYGPRTQLGFAQSFLHDRLRLGVSYNFQFLGFFSADPTLTVDLQNAGTAGRLYGFVDPYRVGWFQEDVSLDLRDRALDPHSGLYLGISAEEGGDYAGGAFQYEKLSPEVRAYLPVGGRVVLAGRAQYGRMFVQGDLGSPITRRLYLGGPGSHRGFAYNRLSAQVPSGRQGVSPIPVGGDESLLLQGELRVDVFRAGESLGLALVAFLDAGDVAAPSCPSAGKPSGCALPAGSTAPPDHVELNRLHLAAGGGARLKTPIGTLRFDVGVRLNRVGADHPDEPDHNDRVVYHVSLGEAF